MRLRALSNINSGQYEAGDEFDTDAVTAQQLIEAGAAELADEKVEPTEEATVTETPLVEQPVASVSPEPQAPVEAPQPPQEVTSTPLPAPKAGQPTEAQIQQDLAAAGEGSSPSSQIEIS